MAREILVCDTSFIGHLRRRQAEPGRYACWDGPTLDRIRAGSLAVSVVTIAETRAGFLDAGWGSKKVRVAEMSLASLPSIPVRRRYVDEWARLWAAARRRGIALSHNDLWVAATASRQRQVLVTCDRDHLRISSELDVEVLYLQPPV